MSELDRLIAELCPDGVKYATLADVCKLSAGGDVPKESFSVEQTDKYNVPIYSNGIGDNALCAQRMRDAPQEEVQLSLFNL
jgi:type I restriction enzyme S subunit